jgi:hypothetical protein
MLIPSKFSGYQSGIRVYPGKSDPPPPPDYASAAKETAAGNREAAEYTTKANRINQVTPYGSLNYNYTPQYDASGKETGAGWTQTMNLTPQAQATLDKQLALNNQFADTASKGFSNISGLLENPNIDQSLLPAAPINAGTTAQQAIMSRLQPTLESNEEALRTRLINQGINLGSTAYNREQALQGQRANDLYLQAAMQGIGLDTNARKDALNEAYTAQSRPLDLVSALRTGAQVQQPQFQNFAQQQFTGGPNMLGAAQSQYGAELGAYNAQNAQQNGLLGGIAGVGLGLAGLPGAGGFISKGFGGLFS